jgi:hypothetical protein
MGWLDQPSVFNLALGVYRIKRESVSDANGKPLYEPKNVE